MKNLLFLFGFLTIQLAAIGQTELKKWQVNDSLKVAQISEHVYIHESQLRLENGNFVGCNGVIYVENNMAILGETSIDSATTLALIHFIEDTLNANVRSVFVTHFHVDALGGLAACHANGIYSYSYTKTPKLAKKTGFIAPVRPVKSAELKLGVKDESMILYYPGPGHTKDNAVFYIPKDKVVFGGCLIKCMNAGYGNLADANMKKWVASVENVRLKFPNAEIIVPGHGPFGGRELLDYTQKLISEFKD
jgi:metallo-beta-lactamase class B